MLVTALHACAQGDDERRIVVEGEVGELPSAYGAPPDLSHGRMSTLTKSYVLSPFSFEVEAGHEAKISRDHSPTHLFRQEIEMGLPTRFTVGLQNEFEHLASDTLERSFTVEARYALANWNKLPLNPAISAEYRFGAQRAEADSGELAVLVSHDFPHLVEWAMNVFVDQEFSGGDSTSGGFAQSIEVPVLLPEEKLELGAEMLYRSGGESPLGRTTKGLAVGPTLAWRPSQKARFDLSPLVRCGDHAPALQVFATLSFSFGGSSGGDTENPASSHWQ